MIKTKSGLYIPGVDGLRSIAVLSVVLYHVGFDQWFSGGYVGVDVFFVISGFLITRLIVKEIETTQQFSFSNFYYRRCKRLYPALVCTVLFSFIFAFLLFTPQHLQRFGGEVVYTLASISNFYFWSESGYFDASSDFKPLLHTWSLSIEEQFYIIWPAALVLLKRKLSDSKLVLFIILGIAISLVANHIMHDGKSSTLTWLSPLVAGWFSDGHATIYYLAPFRVFEFGIGALLVWATRISSKNNTFQEVCMASGLIMVGYAIYTFDETTIFPSYNALIPCIGSALIIYGTNAQYLSIIISNRLAVGLGLISYSIYLVHWPIIVFYKYYITTPLILTEKIVLFVAALLLGFLMYNFVEQPFRKHSFSRSNISKSGLGLMASLSAIVIMIPAASVWGGSGWPWRVAKLPKQIAQQLGDSKKFHVENYGGVGFPSTGWVNKASSVEKVDMVLLGDSHIRHYNFGLKSTFPEKNIYSYSTSCLLLPDTTRVTPGYTWDTECPKLVNSAIDKINNNPGSLLIISHSWGFQLSLSKELSTGNTNRTVEYIISKLDLLKNDILNHDMIIIGEVPGSGTQDIMSCYSKPRLISIDCGKLLTVNENELTSVNNINGALKEYALSREGVFFLDPRDVFCEEGKCFSLVNGKVMYSDKFHLSKEGSLYAINNFQFIIRNLTENRVSSIGK